MIRQNCLFIVLPRVLWETLCALLPKYQIILIHLAYWGADLIRKPNDKLQQISNWGFIGLQWLKIYWFAFQHRHLVELCFTSHSLKWRWFTFDRKRATSFANCDTTEKGERQVNKTLNCDYGKDCCHHIWYAFWKQNKTISWGTCITQK